MHTCHVDLKDPYIVSELIRSADSADLLPVLNADVGGPDTETLNIVRSHAQQADLKNPHPMGFPLHEYTWRTIFLHSLVGRSGGLSNNLFGILRQDALFSVSCPGMSPPQVETALKAVESDAMYIKGEGGKYYASLEPTINKPLMDIRGGLRGSDEVADSIANAARKIITHKDGSFKVEKDVSFPEHVPDKPDKPIIALVPLTANTIDVKEIITSCGEGKPARQNQNLVVLLVPKTVRDRSQTWSEQQQKEAVDTMNRIESMCTTIMAMNILKRNPENYGIRPEKLLQNQFDQRLRERNQALSTTVTQAYNSVWYPSASGQFKRKEVLTAGGEGGASVIEQIRKALIAEGELITREEAVSLSTLTSLSQFFFSKTETPYLEDIRKSFSEKRDWPILEDISQLGTIIREGVKKAKWCLFHMAGMDSMKPDDFYCHETGAVPLDVNLEEEGWCLLQPMAAKKRGWWPTRIDEKKVAETINKVIQNEEALTYERLVDAVTIEYGEIPPDTIVEVAESQVKKGALSAYTGTVDQKEKPSDLALGRDVGSTFMFKPGKVISTKSFVAKKGWMPGPGPGPGPEPDPVFELDGKPVAERLHAILDRISDIFSRGGTSTLDECSLDQLELPGGGRMTLSFENLTPADIKHLDEFWDILKSQTKPGEESQGYIRIENVDEDCTFIREMK